MRVRWFLLAMAAVGAAHLAFVFTIVGTWTDTAITREANTRAVGWADYVTNQMGRVEEIARGAKITPEEYHLLDAVVAHSDVVRFKIYGPGGSLRMISDADMAESMALFNDYDIAHVIARKVVSETRIVEAHGNPYLPEIYSRTLVPLIEREALVGFVEVYLDQTTAVAAMRVDYWMFGHLITALVAATMAIPMVWIATLLRRERLAHVAAQSARRHALDAERARSDFLATLHDDVRAPLDRVLQLADLLKMNDLAEEDAHLVEAMEVATRTQRDRIDDLLTYTKADAGALQLDMQPCDLHAFMREITAPGAALAEAKGLHFTLCLEAPDVIIDTDPRRVRQIVTNLISNAIKYTEAGSITVRVWLEMAAYGVTGRLCVSVADTGIGLSQTDVRHVFERFTRLPHAGEVEAGGAGMGLANARAIAQALQGDLTVTSDLGQGSVFALAMPVAFRTKRGAPAAA